MITYHNGDILKSGADVICHQVNCMGVMGGGLAKQIRDKYPIVYKKYKNFCDGYPIDLLGLSFWVSINGDQAPPYIVNCFAQYSFGRGSLYTDYTALKSCLREVKSTCEADLNNHIIAIPDHIGCGLAGGDWNIVHGIINEVFSDYLGDVQIWKLN